MAFKQKKFSGFKSNGDKNIMLDQVDVVEKASARDKVSTKLEEGGKTSKGFDTKTKTGLNLFGQRRNVTKFYDSKTGKFAGKEVVVTKKDGTKKQYKDRFGKSYDAKTKIVNPGLTQTGGIGKIRVEKGYFGKPKSDIESVAPTGKPLNRSEVADLRKDPNVKKDSTGKPTIPTYKEVFDTFKIDSDGKAINPRNNSRYNSIDDFVKEAESWWRGRQKEYDDLKIATDIAKPGADYGRTYGSANKKRKGFKIKFKK